jgi:hypothetical protein
MLTSLRTIAFAGAFWAAVASAHAASTIGVNAAVNPDSTGASPGGTPQLLAIGQPVVFQEHITTAANGQTKILFRDESSMSVGPNSDLTIDQFLYDPNASTGKLAMSVTKGVFRFVGGEVSKLGDPVTLSAPTATLGIRGGIFVARIAADGSVTAVFVYGKELTVTGRNGAVTTVRRPGFAVSVAHAGDSPSAPFAAPSELLSALVGAFDGTAKNRTPVEPGGSRIASEPLFVRLSSDPDNIQRTDSFGDRLANVAALRTQSVIDDFSLSSVAFQGDHPLLQAIRAVCQQRGHC